MLAAKHGSKAWMRRMFSYKNEGEWDPPGWMDQREGTAGRPDQMSNILQKKTLLEISPGRPNV